MTSKEFENLDKGDLIRRIAGRDPSYIVVGNYGERITAVRLVDVMNPSEWLKDGKPFWGIGDLRVGDKINHLSGTEYYVVAGVFRNHASAVKIESIIFFDEWELVGKAEMKMRSAYGKIE